MHASLDLVSHELSSLSTTLSIPRKRYVCLTQSTVNAGAAPVYNADLTAVCRLLAFNLQKLT